MHTQLTNPTDLTCSSIQFQAPARSVWTRAGLVAPTPPPPRRRVCPPLLDALHPPHDRRPHVPAGGEDGEGNDDDGNQQPKTMAKASSLPLELAPSRSTTRRRTTTVAKRGSQQQSWAEAVGPYIDILRPQNIVPAMLLVLMGAWVREGVKCGQILDCKFAHPLQPTPTQPNPTHSKRPTTSSTSSTPSS